MSILPVSNNVIINTENLFQAEEIADSDNETLLDSMIQEKIAPIREHINEQKILWKQFYPQIVNCWKGYVVFSTFIMDVSKPIQEELQNEVPDEKSLNYVFSEIDKRSKNAKGEHEKILPQFEIFYKKIEEIQNSITDIYKELTATIDPAKLDPNFKKILHEISQFKEHIEKMQEAILKGISFCEDIQEKIKLHTNICLTEQSLQQLSEELKIFTEKMEQMQEGCMKLIENAYFLIE